MLSQHLKIHKIITKTRSKCKISERVEFTKLNYVDTMQHGHALELRELL